MLCWCWTVNGNVAETFFGSLINGPWDMTASDRGRNVSLFVTNVLNGTVAGGRQRRPSRNGRANEPDDRERGDAEPCSP